MPQPSTTDVADELSEENITQKICEVVARAAHESAELVVFPELYLAQCSHHLADGGDHLSAAARETDCLLLNGVASVAKALGIAVCIGYAEVDPAGVRYNSAVLYDEAGQRCGGAPTVAL